MKHTISMQFLVNAFGIRCSAQLIAARIFTALFVLQTLLAAGPAFAQLAGARNAPVGQKPLIDAAANGVPIVHIAPPSTAGVSRNQFEQFNVPATGVILNNSKGNVQTLQGGWIAGNLQMGNTPARIILNEVSGPGASLLRGTIEVAGQRADIVIANPNGISCDGCGFLNTAGRASLVAGQVRTTADGAIAGFDTGAGQLHVGAMGLNASEQEQLDLIARGLVIEGEIWARNIKAITGTNSVLYGTLESVPLGGSAGAPLFSVDIKNLGGMFANQIHLVATEKGLGVNSTGRLVALQGNLSISAEGDLTVKDAYAKGDLGLSSATRVATTGDIVGDGAVRITAPAGYSNTGAVQAASTLLVASPTIDNLGSMVQRSAADFVVTAPGGLRNDGTLHAGGALRLEASSVRGTGGQMLAGSDLTVSAGEVDLQRQRLAADGALRIGADAMRIADGTVEAGGALRLDATGLLDVGGSTVASQVGVTLRGQGVSTAGATVAAPELSIDAGQGRLDNRSGRVLGTADTGALRIVARGIDNQAGEIRGNGVLQLQAGGADVQNAAGLIAGRASALAGIVALANRGGTVYSSADLALDGGALDNEGGTIASDGSLAVTTAGQPVQNTAGLLRAGARLSLDSGGAEIASAGGTLSAQGAVSLRGGTVNLTAARLAAGDGASIDARVLQAAGSELAVDGNLSVAVEGDAALTNASVGASGHLAMQATNLDAVGATVTAGGPLRLSAGTLQGGLWSAGSDLSVAVAGRADVTDGGLVAAGNLAVRSQGLVTDHAHVAGQQILLDAGIGAYSNAGGSVVASAAQGPGLQVSAQGIRNAGGTLASAADAVLDAHGQAFDNAGGTVQVAGALQLNARQFLNRAGTLATGGSISLRGAFDNAGGKITTQRDLVIDTQGQTLDNTGGTLLAGGDATITAGEVRNAGGTIGANGATTVRAGGIDLRGGRVLAGTDLDLSAQGVIVNGQGVLSAGGRTRISGTSLDNRDGVIDSEGPIAILVSQGNVDNTGGRISTRGVLDLTDGAFGPVQTLVNRGGRIETSGALTLRTNGFDNRGGTVLALEGLTVAGGTVDNRGGLLGANGAVSIDTGGGDYLGTGGRVASENAGVRIEAAALRLEHAQVLAKRDVTLVGNDAQGVGASIGSRAGGVSISLGDGESAFDQAQFLAGGRIALQAGRTSLEAAHLSSGSDTFLSTGALNARNADFDVAGGLGIASTGGIDAAHARIAVGGAATATAASGLALDGGTLSASTIVLDAGAGKIGNAAGSITATSSATFGIVAAAPALQMAGHGVDNAGGSMRSGGDLALDARSGAVDNRGAIISAARDLRVVAQGTLTNDDARLVAGRDLGVAAGAVTSRSGHFVARDGNLGLASTSLDVTAGGVQAGGDLALSTNGGDLLGSSALISSGGSMRLASGAAILSNAELASGASLRLEATALDASRLDAQAGEDLLLNTGAGAMGVASGNIRAGQSIGLVGDTVNLRDAQLAANRSVTVRGSGINATNASAQSAGDVRLAATGTLDIADARLTAGQDLEARGSGAGTSQGAKLLAGRDLSVGNGASFDFSGADYVYQYGRDLSVSAQGIRSAGQQVGARNLTLDAGSGLLDNAGGVLAASGIFKLSAQAVDNRQGVISGLTSLDITAGAVDNDAGVIEAGAGGLSISAQGQLTNTRSGSFRGIVSAGDLTILAGGIDNFAGYIGASGAMNVHAGEIDNRLGTLAGAGASRVSSHGGIDNAGGSITSTGNLQVQAASVSNAGRSVVFAGNDLDVSAELIDNSGTLDGTYRFGLLAGGNLSVASTTLDNRQGAMVALGDVTVRATAAIDNRAGQIGGTNVTVETRDLLNTAGRMDAQERLTLRAPRFSADGTIASNGSVAIETAGDYTNTGTVAANGDLTVSTSGSYTNLGTVSAQRHLTLSAGDNLTNEAGGRIVSQGTTLNVGGALTNRGLINSSQGETRIGAGEVYNADRIYGNGVRIDAAITNVGGAAIASRGGDIHFNGSLSNTDGAEVLALGGSINIVGGVVNRNARIDAAVDLNVQGDLQNLNGGLVLGSDKVVEAINRLYITPEEGSTRYDATTLAWSNDVGGYWTLPSEAYPFSTFGSSKMTLARQCTGITESGDGVCDSTYTPTSPVWALFKVAPPGEPPASPPNNGCYVTSGGDGGYVTRDTTGVCGAYWAGQEAYQQSLGQRHDELDVAISAFNASLDMRRRTSWFEELVTYREVTRPTVVSSQPGMVFAGGNITASSGVSQDSAVVAGGTVSGISPDASKAMQSSEEGGQKRFTNRRYHGGFKDYYEREYGQWQPTGSGIAYETVVLDTLNAPRPAATNPPNIFAGAAPLALVPHVGAVSTGLRNRNSVAATPGNGQPVQVEQVSVAGGGPLPDSGATGVAQASGDAPQTQAAGSVNLALSQGIDTALAGSMIAAGIRSAQAQAVAALQAGFAAKAAARPVPTMPSEALIARFANAPSLKGAGYTTATSRGPLNAPASRIFRINDAPHAAYLVETDPEFTDYGRFLGSDWMLAQLELDPERTMKRYGDAFAEQRLVDDQIFALTGRRYLSGYGATEDEYQDLLNAGVMFARAYQLTPGITLSSQQMASLTTDIVWLETQTVHLPDGSTSEALVPRVYLRRPVAGDLSPVGALVSGSDIELRQPNGDLAISGTLYAHGGGNGAGTLSLMANNIHNSGTLAANRIVAHANKDIVNDGGAITGIGDGSMAVLRAGRDIVLRTTTQSSAQSLLGRNGTTQISRTNVDRIATVNADNVSMLALRDIDLQGARVVAGDSVSMLAGGGIKLGSVVERYNLDVPLGVAGKAGVATQGRTGHVRVETTTNVSSQVIAGNAVLIDASKTVDLAGGLVEAGGGVDISGEFVKVRATIDKATLDQQGVGTRGYQRLSESDERLAGGGINAGTDIRIVAARDISVEGASLVAQQGRVSLLAGGEIDVGSLSTGHSSFQESRSQRNSTLSKSLNQRESESVATLAHASLVSGNTVYLRAGMDGGGGITITGSNVVADKDVDLRATNGITVQAATNTESEKLSQSSRKTGGGAVGDWSYGASSQSFQKDSGATTSAASTLGSLAGSVRIVAGGLYRQTGSDVLAPQGDVAIEGVKVEITEARETTHENSQEKFKQSGISIDMSNPVLDAVRGVASMAEAAGKTDNSRMTALAAAVSAAKVYSTASTVATDPVAAASVGVNISLVNNKSESKSTQASDTGRGSLIAAGGNATVRATGAGADSTILLRGSDISGQNAGLFADGQILMQAARNATVGSGSNHSSSSSVGVGINFGASGYGVTVNASASKANGQSNGADTTWTNSHLTAGNLVTLQSGGDATLRGGVVSGHTLHADVAGDLHIESLQDTSTYTQQGKNAGFAASYSFTSFSGGASVTAGRSQIDSHFASVGEQSAFRAGDGGFQVDVKGDTQLMGGAITSTNKAMADGNNSFATAGTLTTSDIQNNASFDAKSQGGTIGVGTMAGSTRIGFGSKDGKASSTTAAAISGIAGKTDARTGEKESGLKPIFDVGKVENDVNAQVAITGAFGKAAVPAVAKYADDKAVELRRQGNEEEAKKWDEGGEYRVGLHAGVGLLTGGLGGAAGAGVTAKFIPTIGEEIAGLNLPEPVRQGLTTLAGAAIGAVGGSAGAGAGAVQTGLNYVSHSPFKGVRTAVSRETARLLDDCGANCTLNDFRQMDQQLARLEFAGNIVAASQTSHLTGQQAIQLGETIAALLPLYGTPIALYQAISGQSLTGSDLGTAERFFNGVAGAIPAGTAIYGVLKYAANDAKVIAASSKYNELAQASYEPFITNGIKANADVIATSQAKALISEIKVANPGMTESRAKEIAAQMIESGTSLPMMGLAAPGSALVKVVPKGDGVTSFSPYWMSPEQARAIATMTPERAGNALGLPAAQAAKLMSDGLDFFKITANAGTTPKVFISEIAPTTQGALTSLPTAKQILVPDRSLWSTPVQVNPFTLN